MKKPCLTIIVLTIMLVTSGLCGYARADASSGGSWGAGASYGSAFSGGGDSTCRGSGCGGGGHHPRPHPVPEPLSFLLLAGGFVGLALFVRKVHRR